MKEVMIYSAEITLAASGTEVLSDYISSRELEILHYCDIIKVSYSGTGVATVTATPRIQGGGDASNDDTLASGATGSASHASYLYSGANEITFTETGAAAALTIVVKAYKS